MRWLDVAALTRGRTSFYPSRGPVGPSPGDVNDEQRPLFGTEGEEPVTPYGSVEEVIELVKETVGRGWEREGVSIGATGGAALIVRGPRDLLDATEAVLARLEKDALRFVEVDVLALAGDPAAAGGADGIPGAIARGELRLQAVARTGAFSGQRAVALAGGVRAYLQDYDVEVSVEAAASDPIVGVQPDGLSVVVVPTLVDDVVHLDVQAWMARIDGVEPRAWKGGQVETLSVTSWTGSASLLRARPGTWNVLRSSGDVVFALRATVHAAPQRPATPSLPAAPASGGGPSVVRSWPIHALAEPRAHARAEPIHLAPSSFTPPEPPELPEPMPLVSADWIVEMLRSSLPSAVLERDDASLAARRGHLHARLPQEQADFVTAFLRHLQDRALATYRVEAVVVSVPRAGFVAALKDLGEPSGASLLLREGARVEGRASVRVLSGQRQSAVEGRSRSYVADYEVEIAEKAALGNPVVQRVLEGLSLDVHATRVGPSSVACEVRFDRSAWRATRTAPTPHGDVELPDLALQRFRGSTVVPTGGSRLLGVSLDGERVVAVVLEVAADDVR